MAGLPRTRAAHRAPPDPYATLPLRLLVAPAVRDLDDVAQGLLLLAHANWTPGRTEAEPGTTAVPFSVAVEVLKCRRSAVTAAFEELAHVGLIVLAAPAIRPRTMGAGRPRAATWRVLSREAGTKLPLLAPGQRPPEGAWRPPNERLRRDVAALRGDPLRLLLALISQRGRDRHGALVDRAPFAVSAAEAVHLLNHSLRWDLASRATAARAIVKLVAHGALHVVEPSKGRRPTTYRFSASYAGRERHLKSNSPVSPVRHNRPEQYPQRDTTALRLTRDTADAPPTPACVSPGSPLEENHAALRSEAAVSLVQASAVPASAAPLPASPALNAERPQPLPIPPAAARPRHRGRAGSAAAALPERLAL